MKKAGVIFLLLVIAAAAFLWVEHNSQPAESWNQAPPRERLITVEKGKSLAGIAGKLERKGAIRSELFFRYYARFLGYDKKLQAGTYRFPPDVSPREILEMMSEGAIETARLSIPEGLTVEEIASRTADNLDIAEDEFMEAVRKGGEGRDYLPSREEVDYRLEGFLYPTTYSVPFDISAERLIDVMLDKFENRWLEELREAEAPINSNLSENELIIIASLVEKEARLVEEKPLIAGVIYNRLEKDMKLQIDATVQYSLPRRQERLLYRDLEVESRYNTYLHRGLPPGPIASPGDNAISAAINPEESNYLFYFARSDGSHVFTESYEEHLEKQRMLD